MKNQTTLIIIVSICWGVMMPLVRKSALPTAIFGTIFAVVSGLLIITYVSTNTQHQIEFRDAIVAHKITFFAISLVVIAALLNGAGAIAYYELFSKVNGFNIPDFLPKTSSLIPLIALILSLILFDDPLTKNKIIGAVIIIFGIYVINK